MKTILGLMLILGSTGVFAADYSFAKSMVPSDIKLVTTNAENVKARVYKVNEVGVIEINKAFMKSLSNDALSFVIKHELAHLKLNHLEKIHTSKLYDLELEADMHAIEEMKDNACEAVKEIAHTRDYSTMSFFTAKTHPDSKELISNACSEAK